MTVQGGNRTSPKGGRPDALSSGLVELMKQPCPEWGCWEDKRKAVDDELWIVGKVVLAGVDLGIQDDTRPVLQGGRRTLEALPHERFGTFGVLVPAYSKEDAFAVRQSGGLSDATHDAGVRLH